MLSERTNAAAGSNGNFKRVGFGHEPMVKHRFAKDKHSLLRESSPIHHAQAMLDTQQLRGRFVQALADNPGLRMKDIAEACEVSPQAVGDWKRTGRIDKRHFPTLARLTHTSLEYWHGEQEAPRVAAFEVREVPDSYAVSDEDILIDVVDVRLSAGGGSVVPEFIPTKRKLAFSQSWLRKRRLKASDLRVMPVHGESMLPTLADGDTVLVDTSDKQIVDGRIYAFVLPGGAKIKRLRRSADGGLIVISDNSDKRMYPDETIPPDLAERIVFIGRAIQRAGDL